MPLFVSEAVIISDTVVSNLPSHLAVASAIIGLLEEDVI